jgi:DNA-binding SARP family transcriptional activator
MDTLHITLFGTITVTHPKGAAPLKLSRSGQALLAYLLLRQQFVPRDVLADVFWRDYQPERARSNLTTALWRLRHALEPADVRPGTYLITKNSGEVSFNWESCYWLDIAVFKQQIHPFLGKPLFALSEDDVKSVEATLGLYHSELLEGLYDDWALCEREYFRSLYLNGLLRLMEFHTSRNNFLSSIAYGQEILRQDPLREEIHRELMHLYLKSGQRTLALHQYTQCQDLLRHELGIAPLAETQRLYQQIVNISTIDVAVSAQALNRHVFQLSHELQLLKSSLDETTRTLAQLVQSVNLIVGDSTSGFARPSKGYDH